MLAVAFVAALALVGSVRACNFHVADIDVAYVGVPYPDAKISNTSYTPEEIKVSCDDLLAGSKSLIF